MKQYTITVQNKSFEVTLLQKSSDLIKFEVNGKIYEVKVEPKNKPSKIKLGRSQTKKIADGTITSPMPGIVVTVSTEEGATVKQGDTLLVVEAMKMENNITSPKAGTVKAVHVKAGQEVDGGQLLVEIN